MRRRAMMRRGEPWRSLACLVIALGLLPLAVLEDQVWKAKRYYRTWRDGTRKGQT